MVARKDRKTITLSADRDEPAEENVGQQKRVDGGQFRLQVDRQTKRSFATYEAAEEAGMAIKKSFPMLQVAVYDMAASASKIIEPPKTG